MSRTIRRKNAWDKSKYVPTTLEAKDMEFYCGGGRYLRRNGFRGVGLYHGCTEAQILEKLNAWYHRELPDNWSRAPQMKEYAAQYLRVKNEAELVKAIARNEEDELVVTDRRTVRGFWWRYYD